MDPATTHTILSGFSLLFSAAALGFGSIYLTSPTKGFSFFRVPFPVSKDGQTAMNIIMPVLGAKNFMLGVSMLAAMYYGHREILGIMQIGFSFCAVVDGLAVRQHWGKDFQGHWNYAPALAIVGYANLMKY